MCAHTPSHKDSWWPDGPAPCVETTRTGEILAATHLPLLNDISAVRVFNPKMAATAILGEKSP
jgi:hypothetical protein